jgi:hypothetical protein
MARIVCLAWLALALWAQSAVTVGWKIPISSISWDYRNDDKVRKLDKPPGGSAFFEPGDEVWDVSQSVLGWLGSSPEQLETSPGRKRWSGEWMVWNARSGMLVVRGSGADIAMIELGLDQVHPPELLRTRIEMGTGPVARSSISLLSRSGEEALLEWGTTSLKLTIVSSGPKGILDATLAFAWPAEGNASCWNLQTALTVLDGQRCRLATQGGGEQRQELFITVTREIGHGIPAAEFRWKDEGTGVIPWPESADGVFRMNWAGEQQIGIFPVPADLLTKLGAAEDAELP